jgi:hypothetical protein
MSSFFFKFSQINIKSPTLAHPTPVKMELHALILILILEVTFVRVPLDTRVQSVQRVNVFSKFY